MPPADIAALLADGSLADTAVALIEAGLARGAPDNITVVPALVCRRRHDRCRGPGLPAAVDAREPGAAGHPAQHPGPLVPPLLVTTDAPVELRGGPDLGKLEHVQPLAEMELPMLAFLGVEDMTLPIEPTIELAEFAPDHVELVAYTGDHMRGWNVDPEVYASALVGFLDQ